MRKPPMHSKPPATLVLFNYDWDQREFAREFNSNQFRHFEFPGHTHHDVNRIGTTNPNGQHP